MEIIISDKQYVKSGAIRNNLHPDENRFSTSYNHFTCGNISDKHSNFESGDIRNNLPTDKNRFNTNDHHLTCKNISGKQ